MTCEKTGGVKVGVGRDAQDQYHQQRESKTQTARLIVTESSFGSQCWRYSQHAWWLITDAHRGGRNGHTAAIRPEE